MSVQEIERKLSNTVIEVRLRPHPVDNPTTYSLEVTPKACPSDSFNVGGPDWSTEEKVLEYFESLVSVMPLEIFSVKLTEMYEKKDNNPTVQ